MGIIKKFRIKSFKNPKPLISLQNISLSFGNRKILDNVNFNINEGEILGMLGPNIPKICPWLILKLTLSKIFLLSKDRDTFSNEIIGWDFLKDLILNFLIIPILFSTFN